MSEVRQRASWKTGCQILALIVLLAFLAGVIVGRLLGPFPFRLRSPIALSMRGHEIALALR